MMKQRRDTLWDKIWLTLECGHRIALFQGPPRHKNAKYHCIVCTGQHRWTKWERPSWETVEND